MTDFITLTCPNCGANLEITQDLERVRCSYCRSEHILSQLGKSMALPGLEGLSRKALRLALDKPLAWEYRLFFQSWLDEVERRGDVFREYRAGLQIESAGYVSARDSLKWLEEQTNELRRLFESTLHLMNKTVQEAFGKPGEEGNAEQIVWVSRTIGRIFEQTIQWAIKVRSTKCEHPFDLVTPELASLADELIPQFGTFPKESLQKIEDYISLPESSRTQPPRLTMVLSAPDSSRLMKALDNAKRYYRLEQ